MFSPSVAGVSPDRLLTTNDVPASMPGRIGLPDGSVDSCQRSCCQAPRKSHPPSLAPPTSSGTSASAGPLGAVVDVVSGGAVVVVVEVVVVVVVEVVVVEVVDVSVGCGVDCCSVVHACDQQRDGDADRRGADRSGRHGTVTDSPGCSRWRWLESSASASAVSNCSGGESNQRGS